jgi:hypothetical protein
MKRFKIVLASFAVALLGALSLAPAVPVAAIDPLADACRGNGGSAICKNDDEQADNLIDRLVDVLLYVVGILAVIMIIVGGILYTISGGDAGKVAKAKNTLTYAIVGLLVALFAFALVNWVFRRF